MRHPLPEELDAIAAQWIGRLDAGLTPGEEIELQRWRDSDRRHEQAFTRFQGIWLKLGRPRRTGAAPNLNREIGAISRRQRRRRVATVGATLMAFLIAGAGWWMHREPVIVGPASAPRVVVLRPERQTLPDGSIIEYPSGTVLSVDYSREFRRVVLKAGEGLFDVAKDAKRPFVVEAAGVEVRALGTAFSVQVGRNAVDVLVTKGTVQVQTPHTVRDEAASSGPPVAESEPAVLTVGQKVIVSLASAGMDRTVIVVEPAEMAERLAWRNPRVEFSGVPFSEVVAVMNQHNEVEFVIDDSSLAQVPMSGLFRANDSDTFVRMLEAGFDIKAEHRSPDQILLRKAREAQSRK